jgi:hypothetical protein
VRIRVLCPRFRYFFVYQNKVDASSTSQSPLDCELHRLLRGRGDCSMRKPILVVTADFVDAAAE